MAQTLLIENEADYVSFCKAYAAERDAHASAQRTETSMSSKDWRLPSNSHRERTFPTVLVFM
jgi:hypothetical protein